MKTKQMKHIKSGNLTEVNSLNVKPVKEFKGWCSVRKRASDPKAGSSTWAVSTADVWSPLVLDLGAVRALPKDLRLCSGLLGSSSNNVTSSQPIKCFIKVLIIKILKSNGKWTGNKRPDQGWYDLVSSNLLVWLHGQDCCWFLKPRYWALPYIMMHYVITLFLAVADGPPSSSDQQNETAPFKLEATVPSRLALGARCGYGQRCWGSPVRQKKKHTGNHFSTNVCIFYTQNKLSQTLSLPPIDCIKEVDVTSESERWSQYKSAINLHSF